MPCLFPKRKKYRMKKEKGCLCCRFPHSSRPISLGVGTEQQLAQDTAGRSTSNKGDYHVHKSGLKSQLGYPHDQGTHCSTTFKMKRKKLKPSVARQVAAIAASRAKVVAGYFTPAVRQAALQNVALVEREEIQCCNLLGVGGFSLVYSVESIDLQLTMTSNDNLYERQGNSIQSRWIFGRSHLYTDDQQAIRRRLAQHDTQSPSIQAQGDRQWWTGLARSPKHGAFSHLDIDMSRDKMINKPLGGHTCYHEEFRPVKTRATMFTGRKTTTNQSRYAIKHLKPELMNFPEKFGKAAIDLACEAEFLLCLDHPHIVKLHGLPLFGPNSYRCGEHHAYFLVMDRMVETLHDRVNGWREVLQSLRESSPSKEFQSLILARPPSFLSRWFLPGWSSHSCCIIRSTMERNNHGMEESSSSLDIQEHLDALFLERIRVSCDIASAIQHIHEKRIIHRDIKTTNIGFDLHGVVKVFDFGLARHLPKPSSTSSTGQIDECFCMSNVGTKRYCAPEVSGNRYNLKSDVYSFGVVLWEILTLNSPQKPPRQSAISGMLLDTHKLRSCPCWPISIQRLVFEMQNHDYRQRPTIVSVRTTLASFLEREAHQPLKKAGQGHDGMVRQGRCRRSIIPADTHTSIFDEQSKVRVSRSASALIEDQETVLSSSLMGMSISPTHQYL